ncbi:MULTISPECIES: hypothetical protein [Salinimonas]|uniref:Uncharacterized protein n=1 Tax=Salinimonas profundi TaxID=2729140 RepID=A0ABR8LNT6_9ALTE|nr:MULTISPECIES: hypothetical protein [Salinimonas]MBD3587258.1 hypothetical protein [Salinimonas profundi]
MSQQDDLEMFDEEFRVDVKGGINRAQQVVDRPFGYYANILNVQFNEIQDYLKPGFRTESGQSLGSSGRRDLIAAFCVSDNDRFNTILR